MRSNERPKGGVGDAFRSWWNALARPAQWAFGVPFILFMALLPLLNIPVLTTEGTNFGGVMAQFGMYALIAIGLNVVVGQAGLLDLGYVGFYAVGRLHRRPADQPEQPVEPDRSRRLAVRLNGPGWPCLPIAMAITAISGLILGSPTLRLRGDYLAIVTLGFGEIVRLLADNLDEITGGGRGLAQVAYPRFGVTEDYPLGVFSAGNVSDDAEFRRLVVLGVASC